MRVGFRRCLAVLGERLLLVVLAEMDWKECSTETTPYMR
jgi:hypothetical protein